MKVLVKAIRILDKIGVFSRWINIIGLAALFSMVLVTFINVMMRYLFNRPIEGVLEITEVIMILAIFLGIGYTQNEKGHVAVDLITERLKPKTKLVLESISTFLALVIIVIVVWRTILQTIWFFQNNSMHTHFLPIPSAPFSAVVLIGFSVLSLLLLRDLLVDILEGVNIGLRPLHWLLMIIVPILVIILSIIWMKQGLWQMGLPKVAVIGVVVSVVLFLGGMPIAYALIITSFIFIAHIRGIENAFFMMGAHPYRTTGSYLWSVIPFFVLMGYLNLHARIGEDLYYSAYKWFGHLRGGLAIATVGACTGFAAIVGDGVAATATMGSVALPEMKKYNYDKCLSSGCIISGGALGPIIPPSAPFVLYGILTGESIGDLFIAGIFPGLLIAAFFILNIYIWCRRDPMAGPAGERSGWVERIKSLKSVGPTLLLFLIVIGGIYTGVFTPTEGGAIGAVGAFVIGLIMRRFTWKIFARCLLEAGKMTSMTFFILIGSVMFTRFAAWCNLSGSLSELFTAFALSPQMYAFIIFLVLFILGFFVDGMPLILIGVPIVYPVAVSLGLDQLWFATMFVLTVVLGTRTPPVGINLFVFKGIAEDFSMSEIYRGAMPFVYGTIVAMVIIFFFPPIVSWLPHALK